MRGLGAQGKWPAAIYAGLIAGLVSLAIAALVGAAFGLLLLFVNLYGIAPVFFPWFLELRGGITVFSHLVFGAVLGGSYVALCPFTGEHGDRTHARHSGNEFVRSGPLSLSMRN